MRLFEAQAAILAKLTPTDQAILRRHPFHTWRSDGPSLRDIAVHEAMTVLCPPGERTRPAAARLATELARYHASSWRHEGHLVELPGEAPPRRVALHRVLRLNDGRLLRTRRIIDIVQNCERYVAAEESHLCSV